MCCPRQVAEKIYRKTAHTITAYKTQSAKTNFTRIHVYNQMIT